MINTIFLDDIFKEVFTSYNESRLFESNYSNKKSKANYTLNKTDDSLSFMIEAMGLFKEDIEMTINENYLIVKSVNNKNKLASVIDSKVHIGNNTIKEKITASLDNGILSIIIPIKQKNELYKISFSN